MRGGTSAGVGGGYRQAPYAGAGRGAIAGRGYGRGGQRGGY